MKTIPSDTFESIYEEHRKKLNLFSLSITKNIHKSEEIVQEVYARLYKQDWNKISGYVNQWLYTVCRNLSIRSIRHNDKHVELFENDSDEMSEEISPDEQIVKDEYKIILTKMINQLSKRQKEVIKYHFLKEMSSEEMKKKMKTSAHNIYFLKCTALAELKKKFDTFHADEKRLRISVKKAPKSRSKKHKL